MRIGISLLALSAFALTASCGDLGRHSAAHRVVRANLIDPDSAKFSDEVDKEDGVCGFVNSKNRLGGYVGKTPYMYRAPGSVELLQHTPEGDDLVTIHRMGFSGSARREKVMALYTECTFVNAWREQCGDIKYAVSDRGGVCAAWLGNKYDVTKTILDLGLPLEYE